MPAFFVRALAFSACIAAAAAHPYLFVAEANSCTAMPTRARGNHGAPTPDPNTVFKVAGPDGASVTEVCRGVTYDVEATFSQSREALMTATVGSLAGGEGDIDAKCGNRFLTAKTNGDPRVPAAKTTLLIPCSVGATVTQTKLAVTSATSSSGAFQKAELSLPIAAAAACPSPCGAAANTTSPAPAVGAAAGAAPSASPAEPASPPPKTGSATQATSLTLLVVVMSAVVAWVC